MNNKIQKSLVIYYLIKKISKVSVFLLLLVSNTISLAADLEGQQQANFQTIVNTDSLVQVIVALVSVLVIIFLLSVILKKFNLLPGSSLGLIKIISGISLNGKDRLLLVQVGSEQILISASPGNIQKIHKLKKPIDDNEISVRNDVLEESDSSVKANFKNILKASLTGQGQK